MRAKPKYIQALHQKQLAFVLDPSPRKCAQAGRRAGKSEGVAALALSTLERSPGEVFVIVAITAGHARRIFCPVFDRLSRAFGLRLEWNGQASTYTLQNGARVWLTGAEDRREIEKLRGPRYAGAVIDEAGSFPPAILDALIDDILDPALMDLGGPLALTGTPGIVPLGAFYTRTTGDGGVAWPTHHWTCLDNPHVPGAAYLQRKREDNHWDETHPTYIREYLGQWVHDESAIVYPYLRGRNDFDTLPSDGNWTYALGVDIGWHDGTAFSLGATRRHHPEIYVLKSWKLFGLTTPKIAVEIEKVRHNMPYPQYRLGSIAVDTAGGSKVLAEDLRATYGIPCTNAVKPGKLVRIHKARGRLLAGTLLTQNGECDGLREEWSVLPWDDARTDHHEQFTDDESDACLYMCEELSTHYKPEEEQPKPGTVAYLNFEQERHKRELQKRMRRASGRKQQWYR